MTAPETSRDTVSTDRRRFLMALGVLGVAGLAGCGGDGDDTQAGSTTTTGPDATTGTGATTGPDATETPTNTAEQPLADGASDLISVDGPVQTPPGATTTVTGTVNNPYLFDLQSVEVTLTASADFEVTAQSDTSFEGLPTQDTRTLEWEVSVPDSAGEFELTVDATYASNTDEATVSRSVLVETSRTLQAENADEMTEASIDTQHTGYTGDGYLNFNAMSGATATYTDLAGFIGDAGDTTLTVRYALGSESSRTVDLTVNGEQVTEVTFTPTGDWAVWETHPETVAVDPEDTIGFETTGDEGPNLDQIDFADTGA